MVYIQLLSLLSLFFSTTYAAKILRVPLKSNLFDFDLPLKPLAGLNMAFTSLSKFSIRLAKAFEEMMIMHKEQAPVRNDFVKVVTTVYAGAGQTFNDVLIDTGSAILWVGGEKPYVPGLYSEDMSANFSVGYGAGGVAGQAFKDRVTVGEATVSSQIIGAANITSGFSLVQPIDGILGLGPTGSNAGEVEGFDSTPTFMDSLLAEKKIDHAIFGVFITPLSANGTPQGQGEITFGGVDQRRIEGDIVWLPQRTPVNFHWEFNVTSFTFGPISLDMPTFARTDTGILGIGIPFDQFFAVKSQLNGTFQFDGSKLSAFICLPTNATNSLPPLNFTLGNKTFSIPPERYIVPKELYTSLNVTDDPTIIRTWISSAGTGAFSFGQKWLESVYTAYDLKNHLIGFAHAA